MVRLTFHVVSLSTLSLAASVNTPSVWLLILSFILERLFPFFQLSEGPLNLLWFVWEIYCLNLWENFSAACIGFFPLVIVWCDFNTTRHFARACLQRGRSICFGDLSNLSLHCWLWNLDLRKGTQVKPHQSKAAEISPSESLTLCFVGV